MSKSKPKPQEPVTHRVPSDVAFSAHFGRALQEGEYVECTPEIGEAIGLKRGSKPAPKPKAAEAPKAEPDKAAKAQEK